MSTFKLKALVCGAVIIASAEMVALIYHFVKSRKKSEEKQALKYSVPIFHKVLFFPEEKIPCRKHLLASKGCRDRNCQFSHDKKSSFIQLIDEALQAKRSLDLCMFSVTCSELAQAIMVKYNQGATVRVITDSEYMNLKGSQIPGFRSAGVAVRHNRSSHLMHHKFLIIDNSIVVTGSFNWTQSAIIGNHENVLITNHPGVVQPYVQEFLKLWKLFSPKSIEEPVPSMAPSY